MNWYCIYTRAQREEQAADYCREILSLEIYYPRLKEYRTIRRVRRLAIRPLFPRYFFCRMDLSYAYRAVRYAPDVIDLVHCGDHPSPVQDGLIGELRRWAGESVDILTITPDLRPGDSVEIVDGPMRGLTAVIVRTNSDRDRVAILLSALIGGAQLTISRSQLRRN